MQSNALVPWWLDRSEAASRCGVADPVAAACKRAEIERLLDEIGAPPPTASDVVEVVLQASNGALDQEHASRIAASVIALYGAGS